MNELTQTNDGPQAWESRAEWMTRLAMESPYVDTDEQMPGDPAYEGPQTSGLAEVVRYLFEARMTDEVGFDLLCLKVLHPEMTYQALAEVMVAAKRVNWAKKLGRVKAYKRLRRFLGMFPEMADVFSFSNRGGDQWRSADVPTADVVKRYDELAAWNMGMDAGGRIRSQGEGGLYERVAQEFRIFGKDGQPSWQAAYKRIGRWRQENGKDNSE